MSSPFLKQVFNKDRTFRPKRKFEPGTQRFELHKKAQASLNAGLDLKLAVQLPAGEDLHDWVAVHVVDFFNRVNLIYGTISDGCTEQSCPVMSGGPKYEYRWQDEHRFRKPTALSAPRYMDLLMDWIEAQINNEELFPTSVGESGAAGGGGAGRAAPVSAHGLAASAPFPGLCSRSSVSFQSFPPPQKAAPRPSPAPDSRSPTFCLCTRPVCTRRVSGATRRVACVSASLTERHVSRVCPRQGECPRLPPFHGQATLPSPRVDGPWFSSS